MFGGRIPLFLFIFHFFITYIHTFIQSHSYNTFIHRHSLEPLSISSSLESSVGRPSLWCRAENQTRACLTGSQHATNWATPHHKLSHAAPEAFHYCFGPAKSAAADFSQTLLMFFFLEDVVLSTCSHQVCCCRWPPCFMGGLSPPLYWLICTGPPCRNITNVGVDTISTPAKISLIFAKL